MARQFVEVLLDGSSILDNIANFRIQRSRNMAVDTITLRLADFSLYSLFDFGLTPTTERLHVATNASSPVERIGDIGATDLTDASEDFVAEGVALDDMVLILDPAGNPPLAQGWKIISVTTTVLGLDTLGSSFTPTPGVSYVILKNQGRFFVEKPDVLESEEDIAIPSLWGRCGLARLTDPFVSKLTRTFTNRKLFSEIVTELVDEAGMDSSLITIDIDDFIVPGNLLTISNQLPLDVITNLARKTNGYVRCDKRGNLHIKKDIFHFAGLPIAQVLGDDEIRQLNERTDYPEFGNRVLVRSVTPEAAQDVRINLELETPCTRGDGRTPVPARAVVTTQRGLPVPNGTLVEWTVTAVDPNPIVFTTASQRTVTVQETITGEEKRSGSLLTVSTDAPIVDVIGVFLKIDTRKLTNFFTGGSFQGTSITLGLELPFSNSLVVVDYIAGGIAKNTIRSFAASPEGTVNFVNAAVGRIRDSATLCINNNRNISLNVTAEPSEYNVCLTGSQTGLITAFVRDNGSDGQLIAINWSLNGPGSLSSQFSIIRNTGIDEFQTSENLFTVNTRYPIASVIGVWLADEGKLGTNFFTQSQNRAGFIADEQKIILGTNLPGNRERVLIEYFARSLAQIGYNAPTGQTGPSVAFVTASIQDGTDTGIVEEEQILLNYVCPDEDGVIPGVDPNTGLSSQRKQVEPDCDDSTAVSRACNVANPDLETFVECVCNFLSGSECPDDEASCQALCEADYNASGGKSSFLCDVESPDEFCKRETNNVSLALLQECRDQHRPATIEKCVKLCLDHKENSDLAINPIQAVINCGAEQAVEFTATGGGPPYIWTTTKGELEVSESTFTAVLKPPPSDNSVGGSAYRLTYQFEKRCGPPFSGFCCCIAQRREFLCDDSPAGGCTGGGEFLEPTCVCTDPDCGAQVSCGKDGAFQPAGCAPNSCPNFGEVDCTQNCEQTIQQIFTCVIDLRSAAQTAAGCNPCALSMAGGAVVTVKDQFGQTAMATVTNGQLVET